MARRPVRVEQSPTSYAMIARNPDGSEETLFSAQDAKTEATIDIYAEIGWFGITAADFKAALNRINASLIKLNVNSPGGDVYDGIAMANDLRAHKARVEARVTGIAASIATVIVAGADSVEMADGSMMMIHNPWGITAGDAADFRKYAEALDKMGDSIADVYVGRAGKDRAYWLGQMAEETWYTASEAVAAGLADSVSKTPAIKNSFDLSIFRNAPKPAEPAVEESTPPDWRIAARRRVAAAQLEVIHGYGH